MDDQNRIQPWSKDPHYWQYKGEPVILLGGSVEDNLYQIPDLESHLDTLVAVGGNYIRNTMSDRDPGDARAFAKRPDGKYDLSEWHGEYWNRFEHLLKLTAEREIIVQLELWDRFDHSQTFWGSDPFNPTNNVNYTFDSSGFEPVYPEHPGKNKQPFFVTPPAMQNNCIVLPFQQAFVRKVLQHTLRHDHVLYCIDNEYSGSPEWSNYWADIVREEARQHSKRVEVTEMFDGNLEMLGYVMDSERDSFVEANKIMAPQRWAAHGEEQWTKTREILDRMGDRPCPLTMDKLRGTSNSITGDHVSISYGKFWRGLLAGYSAVRFHRPVPGSLGLSTEAQHCIRAARLLEEIVPIWDLVPALDRLNERAEDSAYFLTGPNSASVVYCPDGGAATVGHLTGSHLVRWIDISSGSWAPETATVQGAESISTPGPGHWIAVLTPSE